MPVRNRLLGRSQDGSPVELVSAHPRLHMGQGGECMICFVSKLTWRGFACLCACGAFLLCPCALLGGAGLGDGPRALGFHLG